jgi:hypothetical protein
MVKTAFKNRFNASDYRHIESDTGCRDNFVAARNAVNSDDKTFRSSFGFCAEVFWGIDPVFFSQCTDQSFVKNR